MTKRNRAAATARFNDLARQGQQIADVERRKFVLIRDPAEIYKLAALEGLSYEQRQQIVKRIKPREMKT
jgi:hypothetical protein